MPNRNNALKVLRCISYPYIGKTHFGRCDAQHLCLGRTKLGKQSGIKTLHALLRLSQTAHIVSDSRRNSAAQAAYWIEASLASCAGAAVTPALDLRSGLEKDYLNTIKTHECS